MGVTVVNHLCTVVTRFADRGDNICWPWRQHRTNQWACDEFGHEIAWAWKIRQVWDHPTHTTWPWCMWWVDVHVDYYPPLGEFTTLTCPWRNPCTTVVQCRHNIVRRRWHIARPSWPHVAEYSRKRRFLGSNAFWVSHCAMSTLIWTFRICNQNLKISNIPAARIFWNLFFIFWTTFLTKKKVLRFAWK